MAHKKLIITESPTKARALANSIDDKNNFKIISCYGRLLELDPISPENYLDSKEIKWSAINPKNLLYIEETAKISDAIYIATDPDIEGEVIAWQLAKLFEHIEIPRNKISRITINSFTKKGIQESIGSATAISQDKAQSGITRRIFDNFSQFSLPEESIKKHPYIQGSSSRISAPILKSISQSPLETHTIKYHRDGMPLPAYMEVNAEQDYQKLKRLLDRLPPPVFSKIKEESREYEQEGLDFQSLLLKSKELTDQSQSDIYDSLQSLYVKGKISYFRSDCKELSPEHKIHVKRQLKGEGADNISFPAVGVEDSGLINRAQDGHTAIAPLGPIGNALSEFKNLNLEDKILSIIWRHWILNSQERILFSKTGILEANAFENKSWKSLEREFNLRFCSQEISNKFGQRVHFDQSLKPLGIARKLFESEGPLKSIKHSKEESLIRRMIDLQIGRPSTFVYHSEKIGRKFIDSKNKLNTRGLSAIVENSKIGNRLLDIKVSQNIERDLHTLHNEGDSEEIIKKSLIDSGYLEPEKGTSKKISRKRVHNISWGDAGM